MCLWCGFFFGLVCFVVGVDDVIVLGVMIFVNEISIVKFSDDRIFLFFIRLFMVLFVIINGYVS